MADFGPFQVLIDFLMSPPGLFITAIIIISLVYYFFFTGKEEPEYKAKEFEDMVVEDMEDAFKLQGIKVKGGLTRGMDYLGNIDMWFKVRGRQYPLVFSKRAKGYIEPAPKKLKKGEKIPEKELYELYFFRIPFGNRLTRFLRMDSIFYVVVDKKHLTNIDFRHGQLWNVKPDIQFIRFGGVFITSESGQEYLSDIAIKRSHERILTYLPNYPDKINFLEMAYSKMIGYITNKQDIKAKGWQEYKTAEGVEHEAEDED